MNEPCVEHARRIEALEKKGEQKPVVIDEEELANVLCKAYDACYGRSHLNVSPSAKCWIVEARAAIAYFRERANVTTWPVPPVVTDSPDAGQGVGAYYSRKPDVDAIGNPPYAKPDPIEERANGLHLVYLNAPMNGAWLAVAREVEREIRAAKREALIKVATDLRNGRWFGPSDMIHDYIDNLDGEASKK